MTLDFLSLPLLPNGFFRFLSCLEHDSVVPPIPGGPVAADASSGDNLELVLPGVHDPFV